MKEYVGLSRVGIGCRDPTKTFRYIVVDEKTPPLDEKNRSVKIRGC